MRFRSCFAPRVVGLTLSRRLQYCEISNEAADGEEDFEESIFEAGIVSRDRFSCGVFLLTGPRQDAYLADLGILDDMDPGDERLMWWCSFRRA